MVLADLDNDGDLDVVVNCLNAPPLLYRNDTDRPRLAVRLKGNPPEHTRHRGQNQSHWDLACPRVSKSLREDATCPVTSPCAYLPPARPPMN